MRHFTTPQFQSGWKHPANITGGLSPSWRKARVCLRRPRPPSPTSVTSDPPLLCTSLASRPDLALHLCSAVDANKQNAPSAVNILLFSLFLSLPLYLSLPFQSIPAASPHRRWCNPPTPVRNHGLELARRAEQGRHHKKAQLESNRRGKKRKGRLSQ